MAEGRTITIIQKGKKEEKVSFEFNAIIALERKLGDMLSVTWTTWLNNKVIESGVETDDYNVPFKYMYNDINEIDSIEIWIEGHYLTDTWQTANFCENGQITNRLTYKFTPKKDGQQANVGIVYVRPSDYVCH